MNENLKAVGLLPNDKAEQIINVSCENISNAIADKEMSVNKTVDIVLDTANESIENEFEKSTQEPIISSNEQNESLNKNIYEFYYEDEEELE